MFDNHLYTVLLGIVDLAVKQAIMDNDNFETEFVSQPLVSNLFCVSISSNLCQSCIVMTTAVQLVKHIVIFLDGQRLHSYMYIMSGK